MKFAQQFHLLWVQFYHPEKKPEKIMNSSSSRSDLYQTFKITSFAK